MQKYYILYIERGSYTVYFFPHFCLLQYFITTGQKSSWSLSKNWQTKSLHSTEALGWMTKWCITVWMVNPDGALFAQPQGQKRKLLLYHNMFFHSYEGAKYRSCAASLFFFFFFFIFYILAPDLTTFRTQTFHHDQTLSLHRLRWLTSSQFRPLGLPLMRRNSCVTRRPCWGCISVPQLNRTFELGSREGEPTRPLGLRNRACCAVSHSTSFPFQTFIHFSQTTHP